MMERGAERGEPSEKRATALCGERECRSSGGKPGENSTERMVKRGGKCPEAKPGNLRPQQVQLGGMVLAVPGRRVQGEQGGKRAGRRCKDGACRHPRRWVTDGPSAHACPEGRAGQGVCVCGGGVGQVGNWETCGVRRHRSRLFGPGNT